MTYLPIDESTPRDRPVLVYFDHSADPYNDPADPMRLTDYAANAEGNFLTGKGVAIAIWSDGYLDRDGLEAANSYWIPGCWFAYLDGDVTDYAVNALLWCEIPVPTASTIEARSGETAGLDPKDESVAPQGETQNPMNYQENHSHG